jgi:hypothetical protein
MTKFHMMTAHMHAHIDMSSSRFVVGVKAHGNVIFVVEVDCSRLRVAETQVLEKHAEVQRFSSSLRTSDVFAFLRAEESSTAELQLPRTSSVIQEEDVCASALEVVKVCAPIRVREAIENKTVGVVSAVDNT